MPKHLPAFATRIAVVSTAAAAATLVGVLPGTAAAEPATPVLHAVTPVAKTAPSTAPPRRSAPCSPCPSSR